MTPKNHAHGRRCGCTRRSFLRGALGGAGLAAFGALTPLQRLAYAQAVNPEAPDRNYVFAYFGGGWDILLSLDPRDPTVFHEGAVRTTRIQPAYERLQSGDGRLIVAENHRGEPLTFGPHIGELVRHVDRMAVVRGMSMETLTHEVGRRRFITGVPPSGLQARGSSTATLLASRLGVDNAIPNLSLQVESYNRDQPNYASGLRVNTVDDLLRALGPSEPALFDKQARQVGALLSDAAACEPARKSPLWTDAEASRRKAADMVRGGLADRFDFGANTEEMASLRSHFGLTNDFRVPGGQAALAAQAITGKVARCVSIRATSNLDTHFDDWETDQGPRQEAGFTAIARLADRLAAQEHPDHPGESWLDHTTIVGFSEFSRTAMMNARGGRDHSLTNACFVLGAGIRGGQIVGASSDLGMTPQGIDLVTGRPDPGGEAPRPEHVLQVLLSDAGIGEEADLRVAPLEAIRG